MTGLDFVHGDAESLPFSDGSFDAVINVEASHAYPRLTRFLEEVVRVLRPGGTSSTLISAVTANSRLGGSTGRHPVAPGFATRHQSGGAALAGDKFAALNRTGHACCRRFCAPSGAGSPACQAPGLYSAIESGKIEYRMYCLTKD